MKLNAEDTPGESQGVAVRQSLIDTPLPHTAELILVAMSKLPPHGLVMIRDVVKLLRTQNTPRSRATVQKTMKYLSQVGCIARPLGDRRGARLTKDGLAFVVQIKK